MNAAGDASGAATCASGLRSFFEGIPVFGVFVGLVAALFFWGVALSDVEYFTTWALVIHGGYFGVVAFDEVLASAFKRRWRRKFSRMEWQFRWVFVPCLTIAVSVAVSVTYLLFALWDEQSTEEHCADTMACRDLFIEFIIAHYGPPIGYLMAYTIEDVFVGNSRRARRKRKATPDAFLEESSSSSETTLFAALDERTKYLIAVFQLTLFPTLTYASIMSPDAVYGTGASTGGVAIYVATALLWTLIVAYPISE